MNVRSSASTKVARQNKHANQRKVKEASKPQSKTKAYSSRYQKRLSTSTVWAPKGHPAFQSRQFFVMFTSTYSLT